MYSAWKTVFVRCIKDHDFCFSVISIWVHRSRSPLYTVKDDVGLELCVMVTDHGNEKKAGL